MKNKKYGDYGEDLEKISSLFRESEELRSCLESPLYDAKVLKEVIKKVGIRLGLSGATLNFLEFLVDKGRIRYLPEIVRTYHEIADEISGRVRAVVIFAHDLSSDLLAQIKSTLEKAIKKEVILEVEKDPAIVGGVIAKVGDLVFDGSVRSQLAQMKKRLIRR
jgi:F-type H+-transporting ATPase subunit delta